MYISKADVFKQALKEMQCVCSHTRCGQQQTVWKSLLIMFNSRQGESPLVYTWLKWGCDLQGTEQGRWNEYQQMLSRGTMRGHEPILLPVMLFVVLGL